MFAGVNIFIFIHSILLEFCIFSHFGVQMPTTITIYSVARRVKHSRCLNAYWLTYHYSFELTVIHLVFPYNPFSGKYEPPRYDYNETNYGILKWTLFRIYVTKYLGAFTCSWIDFVDIVHCADLVWSDPLENTKSK